MNNFDEDHLTIDNVIPPSSQCATHHYNCGRDHCKSVTVDKRNGNVHFTNLVRTVGITRVVLTPDEFLESMAFIASVALNEQCTSEEEKAS